MHARLFAVSLVVVLAGCSSSNSSTPGVAAPAEESFSAGPFAVPAGTELTMCSFVRGTNDTAMDVVKLHAEQSKGGHHLIVYAMDHPVDLPPQPCIQGGQPGWNQLLVTQDQTEDITFPATVGLHLEPHQQFVMETHYINATEAAFPDVSSSFTMTFAEPGTVTERAAPYFFGNFNIDLKPASALTLDSMCSPPDDMTLFRMQGHEHRHGTKVTVGLVPDGKSENQLYTTTQWDAPPATQWDAGLDVSKTDKLHVTCDWQNSDTSEFTYPQEMCFALGMYWPATKGALFCAPQGQDPTCKCFYQGESDTGTGGSTVEVNVSLMPDLTGVKGNVTAGRPVYCALFLATDWTGLTPNAGALPKYQQDAEGIAFTDATTTAKITFTDVTPNDYRAFCFMDSIAGGVSPGAGDPVSIAGPHAKPTLGATATVSATLDYAFP